jgi:CheY-like chemotaxis protein
LTLCLGLRRWADIAQIPAWLVADVNMPAMAGIELYRRLIDAGRAIPKILVTACPRDSRPVNERGRESHDLTCTAGKVN